MNLGRRTFGGEFWMGCLSCESDNVGIGFAFEGPMHDIKITIRLQCGSCGKVQEFDPVRPLLFRRFDLEEE